MSHNLSKKERIILKIKRIFIKIRIALTHIKTFSPSQKIALSFLSTIFIGAIILSLPVSIRSGNFGNFIDALFTATSATCVTGLSVNTTLTFYTPFGQLVILILIQCGGIGLMVLAASFISLLKRRVTPKSAAEMKEVLDQSYVNESRAFLFGILHYTFLFEIAGAIILSVVFIPKYGFLSGIWKSIFISVSAFCNAGFDILGANSLADYLSNPFINVVVEVLCILGGIGFVVWFDARTKIRQLLAGRITLSRAITNLTIHSKIAICMTLFMIIIPAIMFFLLEFNNPATMKDLSFNAKVGASLFESVTLRTAGFYTIDNNLFTSASKFIAMICMFIGGCPGGTAGGIKVTTLAIVTISLISRIQGKARAEAFNRYFPKAVALRALLIIISNVLILFIGIFLLLITEPFGFERICFEAVSALATVGLTTGITSSLSVSGKIVIIALMYIGRIGIITSLMSLKPAKLTTQEQGFKKEASVLVG